MSRLSHNEQIIYNNKIANMLIQYKKLRKKGEKIDSKVLIKTYNLTRNNKLITYKQLSKILQKANILSQIKWRAKIVRRIFILLKNKNFNREDTIRIIENKFNLEKSRINDILRYQGYGIKIYPEQNIIDDFYKNLSAKEIFTKYNICYATFRKIAKKNNIVIPNFWYVKNLKYNYRNLFEINTINAHLIGLIWSDGSISSARQVVISLAIMDKEYLENIQKYLFIDNNISALTISDRSKDINRKSTTDTVSLLITRIDYVKFLQSQGLTINKERDEIRLPIFIHNANNEIFLAFLRGFFEGDGCLTSGTKQPVIGFSVTKELGIELKNELFRRFSVKSSMTVDKSIFRLSIGGIAPVFYMLLNMYKIEHSILMKRKFKTTQKIWIKFLPQANYLKNIMPIFKYKYILNSYIFDETIKILSSKFSYDTQQINLKNIKTNDIFQGTRKEFYQKYKINPSYINRLLRLERRVTFNWMINIED